MSTVDIERIQLLAEVIQSASSLAELQENRADVEELGDAQLMALYGEREERLSGRAAVEQVVPPAEAPKPPAQAKLELEAQCLALIAACHDGDELRTTVVDQLRPLVASSAALLDKIARQLSSRYTALTGTKGLWRTNSIAKVLREQPSAVPAALTEVSHVSVAQRVLAEYNGDLRTVVEMSSNSWLRWNGCTWSRLADKALGAVVAEQIAAVKGELLADPDLGLGDARTIAQTLGHSSFNSGVISAMGHQREVHVSADDLNTHNEFLTVANGAVHLPTGELVADRDLLLTVQNRTAYNPEAQCPRFEQAVRDTFQGRQEDVDYYELVMGYTVLGSPSERAMFFHLGEGNNGKSLLLGAICHALGSEHAPVLNFRLIASEPGASISGDANTASPAQFKLRHARLGYIDELPKGGVMRDAAVKQFAGGGRIDARQLNQGIVEFDMTASLHVNCNAQVAIRGAQRSTWHRVCPVSYRATFRDDPTVPAALRDEAEGILAWLVRCAQRYLQLRKSGRELRDMMPASARQELEAMKRAQDPLAEWLEDCCEFTQEGGMPSVEGWKSFLAYHADRASEVPHSVKSDRLWFERMVSVPGVRDARGNLVLVNRNDGSEKRCRGFYGIQLRGSGWRTKAQMRLL